MSELPADGGPGSGGRSRAVLDGLVRGARTLTLHDPDRPRERADSADEPQLRDLRVLPLALAAWTAAWWATGGGGRVPGAPAAALGLGILMVTVVLVATLALWPGVRVALRRRQAWLVATALVVVVVWAVGGLQVAALRSGPVADLAGQQAAVSARVVVTGDPTLHPATGGRPPLLSARVQVRQVEGRGGSWAVRAPVLVFATGDSAASWQRLRVGATVQAAGRLRAPDRADDVAAVLSVSTAPVLLAPPGRAARLVERVREGLRQAVAHRRPEPRALVPALVLGDTSALPPELEATFQATGLTHLTAVSGETSQ